MTGSTTKPNISAEFQGSLRTSAGRMCDKRRAGSIFKKTRGCRKCDAILLWEVDYTGFFVTTANESPSQILSTPPGQRCSGSRSVEGESTCTSEDDTNRGGSDYRSFETQADPAICRNECAKDPTCRAFTYVKPGVQGATA